MKIDGFEADRAPCRGYQTVNLAGIVALVKQVKGVGTLIALTYFLTLERTSTGHH